MRRRIGPFHAENPPAQAGKTRSDSVLCRGAAVGVTRRPQASEERNQVIPSGSFRRQTAAKTRFAHFSCEGNGLLRRVLARNGPTRLANRPSVRSVWPSLRRESVWRRPRRRAWPREKTQGSQARSRTARYAALSGPRSAVRPRNPDSHRS